MLKNFFQRTLLSVIVCAGMLALVPTPASAQLQLRPKILLSSSGSRGNFGRTRLRIRQHLRPAIKGMRRTFTCCATA